MVSYLPIHSSLDVIRRKLMIYISILCGDHAIKQIDKPFILATETEDEWAL